MIFSDSSDGFSVEPWWKSEFLVADFVRYIFFLFFLKPGAAVFIY